MPKPKVLAPSVVDRVSQRLSPTLEPSYFRGRRHDQLDFTETRVFGQMSPLARVWGAFGRLGQLYAGILRTYNNKDGAPRRDPWEAPMIREYLHEAADLMHWLQDGPDGELLGALAALQDALNRQAWDHELSGYDLGLNRQTAAQVVVVQRRVAVSKMDEPPRSFDPDPGVLNGLRRRQGDLQVLVADLASLEDELRARRATDKVHREEGDNLAALRNILRQYLDDVAAYLADPPLLTAPVRIGNMTLGSEPPL